MIFPRKKFHTELIELTAHFILGAQIVFLYCSFSSSTLFARRLGRIWKFNMKEYKLSKKSRTALDHGWQRNQKQKLYHTQWVLTILFQGV